MRPFWRSTKKPWVIFTWFGGMSTPPALVPPIRWSTWRYFGSWPFG